MKRSRFTKEQIIGILREQEAGVTSDTSAIYPETFLRIGRPLTGLPSQAQIPLKAADDPFPVISSPSEP